jgi:hypothetical protein
MSQVDTPNLPAPPWNVSPFVIGSENGDPPRLVTLLYYPYRQGLTRGDVTWVSGDQVDAKLQSGAIEEHLSVNTREFVADAAGDDDDEYEPVDDDPDEPELEELDEFDDAD